MGANTPPRSLGCGIEAKSVRPPGSPPARGGLRPSPPRIRGSPRQRGAAYLDSSCCVRFIKVSFARSLPMVPLRKRQCALPPEGSRVPLRLSVPYGLVRACFLVPGEPRPGQANSDIGESRLPDVAGEESRSLSSNKRPASKSGTRGVRGPNPRARSCTRLHPGIAAPPRQRRHCDGLKAPPPRVRGRRPWHPSSTPPRAARPPAVRYPIAGCRAPSALPVWRRTPVRLRPERYRSLPLRCMQATESGGQILNSESTAGESSVPASKLPSRTSCGVAAPRVNSICLSHRK